MQTYRCFHKRGWCMGREDHGDHHEHNHGAFDAHIWLGTKNVIS